MIAAALAAAHSHVEVWPENWPAFLLFSELQTQWRVGMNGPSGLDYNVLFKKLDRMGLSESEYADLEDDIRVMEFEALSVMHEND